MKTTTKANNKVDSLIRKAKEERDERGYRENLGYDSIHKLDDYLQTLDLSYQEEVEITRYFYSQCDTI